MAETLSILTYGKVIGRFVAAIGDTFADGDFNPEVSPLTGQITFVCGATEILIPTATPAPVTMMMQPIMATLDINGYLTFNNAQGVYLIATNNSALNPTGFTWTAQFNLSYNNVKQNIPDVSFLLPAGVTLDLTTIAPVPGFSGTPTAVGPGVAAGGATGYVLAKNSTANYDTIWVPQTGSTLPSGAVVAIYKSGSTWPARPTTRTDITYYWIGADPPPAIVSSPSTGGMYNTDLNAVPAS